MMSEEAPLDLETPRKRAAWPWKRIAAVVLLLLIGFLALRGSRSRVVVQPFTTAASLEGTSATADGLTKAFTVALISLVEQAETHLAGPNFSPPNAVPDIEVPATGLRLAQVLDYVANVFGMTPFQINLHYVHDNARCTLLLSVTGSLLDQPAWKSIPCDANNIDADLRNAARAALRVISPVTLAAYCRDHDTECEPVDPLNYAVHHAPDDDDIWAYNLWGTILMKRGDLDAGEVMLREALRLDPNFGLAQFNLGYALEQLGRPVQAQAEYQNAARSSDTFVQSIALTNLGLLHLRENRNDDAEAALRRAIAAGPRLKDAYSGLGNVLYRGKNYDGAISMYARAYMLAPQDVLAVLNWGRALEELGKAEEAGRRYRLAAATGPTMALPHYALANWHVKHGRTAEAIASFQQYLAIAPSDDLRRPEIERRLKELDGTAGQVKES